MARWKPSAEPRAFWLARGEQAWKCYLQNKDTERERARFPRSFSWTPSPDFRARKLCSIPGFQQQEQSKALPPLCWVWEAGHPGASTLGTVDDVCMATNPSPIKPPVPPPWAWVLPATEPDVKMSELHHFSFSPFSCLLLLLMKNTYYICFITKYW